MDDELMDDEEGLNSRVVLTMVGRLPYNAFSEEHKSSIERAIEEEVVEVLGEYEIWGERFGDDDRVYSLFLNGVDLERMFGKEESKDSIVEEQRRKIGSLEEELGELKHKIDELELRPKKYSINELDITYTALPFCEHCGENHEEYGVEIREPNGGVSWCLDCFTTGNELCEQDIALIRKESKEKRKVYFKERAEE